MESAAFAYTPTDEVAPFHAGRADAPRLIRAPRAARPAKTPLRMRIALILGGALLGWAVPIACAATFL
jgi:hypothetical protein